MIKKLLFASLLFATNLAWGIPQQAPNGGTSAANPANTALAWQNSITFNGNYTSQFNLTGNTSVTLPTVGTLMAGQNNLSDVFNRSNATANLGLGAEGIISVTDNYVIANPAPTKFAVNVSAGKSVKLPSAQGSNALQLGQHIQFINQGSQSFDILDSDGTNLFTISPGENVNIFLADNSTSAGAWGSEYNFSTVSTREQFSADGNLAYDEPTGTFSVDIASTDNTLNVDSSTPGVADLSARSFVSMTTTQQNALPSPATGRTIYNETTNTINYYDGTQWQIGLALDKLIAGDNITLVQNGDGTVTVNASGSSPSGNSDYASFSWAGNAISSVFPLTNTYYPLAINAATFNDLVSSNFVNEMATILTIPTPVTRYTDDSTQWFEVNGTAYVKGSAPSQQEYSAQFFIERADTSIEFTNCIGTAKVQDLVYPTAIPLSCIVQLSTNDRVGFTAQNIGNTTAFTASYGNFSIVNVNAAMAATLQTAYTNGSGIIQGNLNTKPVQIKNSGGTALLTSSETAVNIAGNASTVTTNANLTGPVTSTGNATAIANGAISNAMLANGAVANLSGTNTGDQTITLTGNVTGSGTGSFAATIAANAVSYAKFQQIAASSLFGNPTGSLANGTEIPLGATLAFSGGALQTTGLHGDITSPDNSFNTTLATVNGSPGTYGDGTHVTQLTVNGKGLVTAASSVTITGAAPTGSAGGSLGGTYPNPSVVTNANLTGPITSSGNATSITNNAVNYAAFQQIAANRLFGNPTGSLANGSEISLGATLAFSGSALQTVAISGDVTSSANSFATTLATVNSNVGSFGSVSQSPSFTVNAKGLVTAASNNSIQIAESQVTNLTTDLAAKANDSAVVHNTGNETVNGIKTFGSTIVGSVNGNAATVTTNANLTGDVTSSGNATTIGPSKVTNSMLAGAITDNRLSTISAAGKVANSATTATSANTASAIVARDGSGNFSAGVITATNFSIANTGTIIASIASSTTGSANGANLALSRGDSANGFSTIYYKTGSTFNWAEGLQSGDSNFYIQDVVNGTNIVSIFPGSGTSSSAVFAGDLQSSGHIKIQTAGKTLYVKQGTNACAGSGTFSGASTAVLTSCATTGDLIFIQHAAAGGTPGVTTYTINSGTGFTATNTTGSSDTSGFVWWIQKAA